MPKSTSLTIILLFTLVFLQGFSQISRINTDSLKNTLLPGQSKFVVETFSGDSVTSRQILDKKEDLNPEGQRYIVRFSASPLMGTRLKSSANITRLENEHTLFKKDFSEMLSRNGMNRLKSSSGLVQREFKNLINGVAVTMPSALTEQVKKLSYVTGVEKDELVKVSDETSNAAIQVPQVWNELGYTGKGVVIAIIDTGVDTSHICFSGDKFVKGYDFANNDDDPFDDHFHGTHVAGIAAANAGQIKGVAPGARIMPVKVMNKDGYGRNSDIIAGIEFALDPDHNPATRDGARVLSLSLGGQGYPDDAMSSAIDNAVLQGAVCVVAAGNTGSSNYTIQSPGCARKALTVGSCSGSGVTSIFSSRGPSQITQAVKPEVSAPGEGIYSSTPGNNYQALSGTSMATPHVAGLAALLLEKHPGWDAENIKSSIIQSAQSVSGKVLEEGFGMVNAYKALESDLVIAPYVLDLGVVDTGKGTVTITKEIQVSNTTSFLKNISISEGEKTDGFGVSVSSSSIILNPGQSEILTITFTIDPLILNIQDQIPMLCKEVIVKEGDNINRVPVVCLIGKTIRLSFDRKPDLCTVFNADWSGSFNIPLDVEQAIVLGKSRTDLVISYDNFNRFVVKENIEQGSNEMFISSTQAKNEMHVKAFSPDGQRLNLLDGTNEELKRKNGIKYSGFRIMRLSFFQKTQAGLPDIIKHFTDISTDYVYENSLTAYPSFNPGINQIIKVPFGLNQGINASKDIVIKSRDYRKIHLNFELDNYSDSLYYTFGSPNSFIITWDPFNYRKQAIKAPYHADFYFLPDPYDGYSLGSATQIIFWKKDFDFNYGNIQNFESPFATGYISVNSKGKVMCSPVSNWNGYISFELEDKNLEFNENLKTLDNIQVNIEEMTIPKFPGNISFGHNLESINDTIFLKIKHPDGTVDTDKIYSHQSFTRYISGNYKARVGSKDSIIASTFYPFDKRIVAKSLFEIQPRCQFTELYRFPWQITLMGNALQNKYLLPGQNSITFKGSGTMKVWIRKTGQKDWQEIAVNVKNSISGIYHSYAATMPSGLGNGYYDLRIRQTTDPQTPNELQTSSKWMPAFYVCNDTEADSLCLVNLFINAGGEKWINHSGWLKEKLSNWYGVTVQNGRVVAIKMDSNNLSGSNVQDLAKLTQLASLDLSGNRLSSIPDLTGIQSLKTLNVQKNKLDFSSIVPNSTIPYFNFTGQDSLWISSKKESIVNDSIVFILDAPYKGNHYKWFKMDQLVFESDSSSYILLTKGAADSGSYYCKVYNSDIPDFYIPTRQVTVKIQEKVFETIRDQSIETFTQGITGTNWVDVDNDGDEDLFLANREYDKSGLFINKMKESGKVTFEKNRVEPMFMNPVSICKSTWADYNNDGLEDLATVSDHKDDRNGWVSFHLFENSGNNRFIQKDMAISHHSSPWEAIKGMCWTDFNHDNFLDLAVGYEELTLNVGSQGFGTRLINNNGDFKTGLTENVNYAGAMLFADISRNKGTEMILANGQINVYKENDGVNNLPGNLFWSYLPATITSTLGDFDNDGDLDLFFPVNSGLSTVPNTRNAYVENVSGTFIERKDQPPTLKASPSASGSVCFDFDNDGDLDLAVSNMGTANELYKNLFMETGALAFEPVIDEAFDNEMGNWIGISVSDLDMDGYLDLTKVSQSGVYFLKNKSKGNNWLSVKCKGVISNASAIGAKVYAVATIQGKRVSQYREILAASGETSLTSRALHFGLGDATRVDSLVIRWPSGLVNVFKDIQINQYMELSEALDQIPVADAGMEQQVNPGELVTLDGSASFDFNGETLSYQWSAPAGVVLNNPNTVRPSFTAPMSSQDKTYLLKLVVTNSKRASLFDQVQIIVKRHNTAPVARAGMDQVVNEGQVVTLDATTSSDAEQDPLTYLWKAPQGITLSAENIPKPSFTAPQVKNDSVLIFSLVVRDYMVPSGEATVKVSVKNLINVGNTPLMHALRFKVYPNPAKGIVNVEALNDPGQMVLISLTNDLGLEVLRKQIRMEPSCQLDFSTMEDGLYVLKLMGSNFQQVCKIVIRK